MDVINIKFHYYLMVKIEIRLGFESSIIWFYKFIEFGIYHDFHGLKVYKTTIPW